jgi:hypothetical protein
MSGCGPDYNVGIPSSRTKAKLGQLSELMDKLRIAACIDIF